MASRRPERSASDEAAAPTATSDVVASPMSPMERFRSLARRLAKVSRNDLVEAERQRSENKAKPSNPK